MSDIVQLKGRAGVVHKSSHWAKRYGGSIGPRRFLNLGVMADRFLRIVEIDDVFYVGCAEPMLAHRARASEQVLRVIAAFDDLDAAMTCYRTELGQ